MSWLVALLSLAGNVLVIKKHWSGFACWVVANLYWIYHNQCLEEWAQVSLSCAYTGFAVWGLIAWFIGKKHD